MKMIKLTLITEETGAKSQAFLNPETFVAVQRNTKARWTVITLTRDGTNYALATQTPKTIFKLIAQAQDMSAPDVGLYDTTFDKAFDELVASFDRSDDDSRAFAEYDKDVLDGIAFEQGKAIQISDVTVTAKVASVSSLPNGTRKLVLQGDAPGLGHVQAGDEVQVITVSERIEKYLRSQRQKQERDQLVAAGLLPADCKVNPSVRTPEDIGDDIRLLIEFHDADDHLDLGAAEMARLVELGWIVVMHEGIVLDADEVAAFDSETATAFLGMTKAGFAMLDQVMPSPEEAALDRLNARGVA